MPRFAIILPRAAAWLSLVTCMSMSHAGVFGDGDRVMLQVGPYVFHRLDNDGHYAGRRWFLDQVNPNLYVKISAGVVYGYKEPYEDRLPVNDNGYGLGIAPALGYQIGRANAQIVFLGTSAVTLTFGYNFWN